MISAIGFAVVGLAGLANAHMFMAEPTRFSSPAATNGPLLADGSNFPCQNAGGGYEGVVNTYELGSSQQLRLQGVAVHGGGSCQISLTTDAAPTKSSKFRVIHSIQGGCPATNERGNLPGDDPLRPSPFQYNYPIPDNIPAGNYTLAWSWINRIGNREFYMECAKVALTGTGGPSSNFDGLPEITTANIGNGCTTTENFDYKYYMPGSSVVNLNMTELIFPVGSSCLGASGGGGSGGGGGYSPSSVAPAPSSSPSTPATGGGGGVAPVPSSSPSTPASGAGGVAPAPSSSPSAPGTGGGRGGGGGGGPGVGSGGGGGRDSGGIFITQPSATATAGAGQETSPAVAAPNSPGNYNGPSSPSTTTGAQTAGSACSDEGEWNCIGSTSYQRCASGTWSAVMQVSAGTQCVSGQSKAITIGAIAVPLPGKLKRESLMRRRSHVARHARR